MTIRARCVLVRSRIRKALKRMALECLEVRPGSVECRRHAVGLMPLEIALGDISPEPSDMGEDDIHEAVYWRPGEEANGFFLILGASGSGKTETLKTISGQLMRHGFPVLVLDFHGDVVVPCLRSELMSSGTGSSLGINPMELDSHQAHEVGLYDQRMALLDLIERAVPRLSHHQRSMLSNAMAAAYERRGIYDDPRTWVRPAPDFGQVLGILGEWLDDEGMKPARATVRGCIAAVQAVFGHPVFSRPQALSMTDILLSGLRIDLSKAPDSIRYIVADTVLRKIFRMLVLQGAIPTAPCSDLERFRVFLVVDEAKILSVATGRPNASGMILNTLITEGRKFGIGLILASQMSEHFGYEVRANAATWLVLKPMDHAQAKRNALDIQIAPSDLLQLRGKGEGYIRLQQGRMLKKVQVRSRA